MVLRQLHFKTPLEVLREQAMGKNLVKISNVLPVLLLRLFYSLSGSDSIKSVKDKLTED